MLKWYFPHGNEQKKAAHNGNNRTHEGRMTDSVESENPEVTNQAASVACVLKDEETDEAVAVKNADTLLLYNLKQKETVNDVIINPELSRTTGTDP